MAGNKDIIEKTLSDIDQTINHLEELKYKILLDIVNEEDLKKGLQEDVLNTILHKSYYLYAEEECPWTGKKIYIGDPCFYSKITLCYYTDNFKAVKLHHMKLGYEEEEIRKWNEDLDIYYTDYTG